MKKKDLTNQFFGRLTVLYDTGEREHGRVVWMCQCSCGNLIKVNSNKLLTGNTRSCGCLLREIASQKMYLYHEQTDPNLLNQVFGKLTVIEKLNEKNTQNRRLWLCQCECGNIVKVSTNELMTGNTKSCGCMQHKSFGEEKIANILTSYKIPFQREYIDLNYYYINSNRHPKFDFFVNNNYYIEYDGIQHFMPQHFFEPLEKQQQRDREKTNYCLKSEIPLIRIPYTHFDNISLQDLLISTSKFIVEE